MKTPAKILPKSNEELLLTELGAEFGDVEEGREGLRASTNFRTRLSWAAGAELAGGDRARR